MPKLDLSSKFIHARPLRTVNGESVLCDPDFSTVCGYSSDVEADLLYRLALARPGKWLEIGTHTGWTAAYLASSGSTVMTVDRELTPGAPMLKRAVENWRACGVVDKLTTSGATSLEFFAFNDDKWDGIFIDGDHDAPIPVWDAMWSAIRLNPKGIIVFHDHAGKPVADAADVLVKAGFQKHVYKTQQELAVCWRGEFTDLPKHETQVA